MQHRAMRQCRGPRQAGIALPFLAISAAMLFGFVALVVDLGRLMVVRAEVQSAADSCALAAVDELDRTRGQLTRAEATGRFVAGLLPAGFQKPATGQNRTTATLRFSTAVNGAWVSAANVTATNQAANYRVVECVVSHPGVTTFFAQLIGASVDGAVTTVARATGVPSQTACVFPLALERANIANARPWGLVVNEVYRPVEPFVTIGLLGAINVDLNYQARLVDFTVPAGTVTGASNPTLIAQFGTGLCDVPMTVRVNQRAPLINDRDQLNAGWAPWNARFGVYTNNSPLIPSANAPNNGLLPDLTGWAPNPPPLLGVLSLTVAEEDGRFQNPDGNGNTYHLHANARTVMPASARPNNFAPSPAQGNHNAFAASGRRLVVVPVTTPPSNGNGQMRNVVDYACVLLHRPIGEDAAVLGLALITYKLSWALEFLGFANAADSPCRSHGTPGGASSLGPLVPALIQ
ncbi:MAG: hypothetical protein K9J04_04105 [Burkholderiales bacterium]|nr:hypothetical protein [Burkholderiales bacterium]